MGTFGDLPGDLDKWVGTICFANCSPNMDKQWIILYDGYCNLCSKAVQWIVRNDRKGRFTFVPLQHAGRWEALKNVLPRTVPGSTGSGEMSVPLQEKWRRGKKNRGPAMRDPSTC